MTKLDGLEVSNQIRQALKVKIAEWASKNTRSPGLSVVLVGDDPASLVYVSHKEKACKQVGIKSALDSKLAD